jgi:hypothetical protein
MNAPAEEASGSRVKVQVESLKSSDGTFIIAQPFDFLA